MTDEERAKRIAAVRKKARQVAKNTTTLAVAPATGGPTASPEASPSLASSTTATGPGVSRIVDEPELHTKTAPHVEPVPAPKPPRTTPLATAVLPSSGPISPDGETAADIYKKQAVKIDELDKENRRLKADLGDLEKRWQKAEEDLVDFREGNQGAVSNVRAAEGTFEELNQKIVALERHNANLQQHISRGTGRHGSSSSVSALPESLELKAQLASKTSTIEAMEVELSRLRAQIDRQASSASSDHEQISALEDKLSGAERAASAAQREATDLRRALDRNTGDSVRVGVEKTSSEHKIRTLERELADSIAVKQELEMRASGLDKKVVTLTSIHREQDSRMHALRREKEIVDNEVRELRLRIDILEEELHVVLPESDALARSSAELGIFDGDGATEGAGGGNDRLMKRIKDLESELYDLRTGVWRQKRHADEGRGASERSPNNGFQVVDLSGPSPTAAHEPKKAGGGLGELLATGYNVLIGSSAAAGDDTGLLDEALDFDDEAFRKASEEESAHRAERLRLLKLSLKSWEGWRMDIREARRGGGEGIGEIFEV